MSEAEDVVQEGFLRLHRMREGGERIESPRAYLSTVVSRLLFRAQTSHEPVYAATCSDYVNVIADVPVLASSGTGLYRGIRGNFSLALTGNEDQLTAPCRSGFARQILVLTGSGTVSS